MKMPRKMPNPDQTDFQSMELSLNNGATPPISPKIETDFIPLS